MINWELIDPTRKRKRKGCDGCINFGTSNKGNPLYYMSFYESGYDKLNNAKKISLGFNETRVYVTNKTTPKMFAVNQSGKSGNLSNKRVCEKVIEYLTNKAPDESEQTMVYIDLIRQKNDPDIFEIKIHEETDKYGFII